MRYATLCKTGLKEGEAVHAFRTSDTTTRSSEVLWRRQVYFYSIENRKLVL